MRFAVHGPSYPVASPRSHGMPRPDVPGRVHVGVGAAVGAPKDVLALARLPEEGGHRPGEVPQRLLLHCLGAVVPRHRFLGGRGEQPVPGHANTLATAADMPGGVKRRFLPGLNTGLATPRSR